MGEIGVETANIAIICEYCGSTIESPTWNQTTCRGGKCRQKKFQRNRVIEEGIEYINYRLEKRGLKEWKP